MSSLTRTTTAIGALGYGRIFVGPADHMLPIMVNIANLTTREVDDRGYLKPGVIFSRNGTLLGPAGAATAVATPGAGNVGNGAFGAVTADAGAATETITLTLITVQANAGIFSVTGSVSGVLPNATVAVAYNGPINMTIADGATDFALGDSFTVAVSGGVQAAGFGVVPEATNLTTGNTSTLLTAVGIKKVIVATVGQLNRDIIEDNLGAALTDDEVNGLVGTPLVLSN